MPPKTGAWAREPRFDPRRFPPASREPRVVQTLRTGRDPLGYMSGLRERLGPVFTLRLMPFRAGVICATDAATNREVLTDTARFPGGDAASLLEPVIGGGSLIITPPPRHMPNRKRLLPPFHGERVARWEDRVRELVSAMAGELEGGEVAVRPWAQRLTLDVILRMVFGVEDPRRVAAFRSALNGLMSERMVAMLFAPGPLQRDLGRFSPKGVLNRRKALVDRLIRDEVAARRASDHADRDDVLSILLAGDFTDDELRDELMGLVIAGHETTATAIAWTLHLLAHHPAQRDALIEDLDGGGDTLLKATIKESMRLRAPVFDAIRTAAHDTELGGRPVPANAFVSAMFCITHLDGELWPDPLAFKPERHLDGAPAPYSLTPFGGGVRRCIGAALAQLELEVVLRELLARGVPVPAGPPEPVRLNAVTLIPARGGRIVLHPRVRATGSTFAGDELAA